MISEGDIFDVWVDDLGYGAKALSRISSLVVWMNGALPGDLVRIKIVKRKPKYAIAKIIEFLKYSDLRVKPRSIQCLKCGGCHLIEMKYENQLYYKARQLHDILVRIGKIKGFVQKAIVSSPKIFRYRNKMEFSFGRDRERNIILGLHRQGFTDQIVGIEKCHLQSVTANRIFKMAKDYFSNLSERYINESPLPFQHFLIREGKNTGDYLVALEAHRDVEQSVIPLFNKIKGSFPEVKSSIFLAKERGREEKGMVQQKNVYGNGTIEEMVNHLTFRLSYDSFFQVNTEQAARVLTIIKELVKEGPLDNVLDLYCGSGSISLFLAEYAKETLGIDISPSSIRACQNNADINGLKKCHFLCMDALEATKKFLQLRNRYDLIVANPPRSGLPWKVIANIALLSPRRIIYISCNPSTLARDCQRFQESGYLLREVIPIDMFPHTYHIEAVTLLMK